MKKVLLVFLGLMICGFAFADASFEIIAKDIDDNGNIRIWTCHKVDGLEVPSAYPKIDDHYVYCTRYTKQNFLACKDTAEIEAQILTDIQNYSKALIKKEFDKKAPKTIHQIKVDYNAAANQDFTDVSLDKLTGQTLTTTEAKQQFDSNNDGVLDKEITVKTDGTKTETNITP